MFNPQTTYGIGAIVYGTLYLVGVTAISLMHGYVHNAEVALASVALTYISFALHWAGKADLAEIAAALSIAPAAAAGVSLMILV